jgi:fructokinase
MEGTAMFNIIGLGEVLWDIFPDGKALGGAPCNFAYQVKALGHAGIPLTRVGDDQLGHDILNALTRLGLPTEYVQIDPSHPTGRVMVKLDDKGVPDFTIVNDVAWDYMEAGEDWLEAARKADAVCFGTLAQRSPASRQAIEKVLEAARGTLIVFDVNFRQKFFSREVVEHSLRRCTIVKLNEGEIAQMRELVGGPHDEQSFVKHLMSYGPQVVCITRGENGCTLYDDARSVSRPVPPTRVADTVGSGDAFTAALVIKRLEGRPLERMAEAANLLGAFVASCRGATPVVPRNIIEQFESI